MFKGFLDRRPEGWPADVRSTGMLAPTGTDLGVQLGQPPDPGWGYGINSPVRDEVPSTESLLRGAAARRVYNASCTRDLPSVILLRTRFHDLIRVASSKIQARQGNMRCHYRILY